MQDGQKAVWSIPYVSVAFFPTLKHNFIAYRSSNVSLRPDCIFEIHQLWQSGFSRVYSNSCCSYSFKPEIIKIGQSSYKMYTNKILNFQESMTILDACTKKSGNILNAPYLYICICVCVCMCVCEIDFFTCFWSEDRGSLLTQNRKNDGRVVPFVHHQQNWNKIATESHKSNIANLPASKNETRNLSSFDIFEQLSSTLTSY